MVARVVTALAWLAWGALTAFLPGAAPERDPVAVLRTWVFVLAICTTVAAGALGKRDGAD
jgi:hypothetical protein